jgi:hypothetical protein
VDASPRPRVRDANGVALEVQRGHRSNRRCGRSPCLGAAIRLNLEGSHPVVVVRKVGTGYP